MNAINLLSPDHARRRRLGLLCAGMILAGLLALGWWSGGGLRRSAYHTFLPQPGGLAKGSAVTLQGLATGRVSGLRLAERAGHLGVEVDFWVERDLAGWVRHGTLAVAVADLVGPARLELRPGPAPAEQLPAGAELPGSLAPDAVTQLLELQPAVKRLIEETGGLAASLNARSGQLDPVLAGLNRQLDSLQGTQEQMRTVLTEAHALFKQTADDERAMTASFTGILQEMNTGLLPKMGRTLEENNLRLGALFASLERTTGAVERKLPRLLELSEETMRNSRDVSEAAAHTWPFSRYLHRKQAHD
jgi:ABC-type transporter Mla subunit MlaD